MGFEQHCIVELMGHQRIAGKVTEQEIGGTSFLRVDVPAVDGIESFTKFYSAGAVYAITPVDEATCNLAVQSFRERPIETWRFNAPLLADELIEKEELYGDEDDDDLYVEDDDLF